MQHFDENYSLGRMALIAGLAILLMAVTVPFVEFYIFPKLIGKSPVMTVENIRSNLPLFSGAIFIHFTTVVCDIVSGWALYLLMRPAHPRFAMLTAWFRIANAAMTVVAVSNLVQIVAALSVSETVMPENELVQLVTFRLSAFDLQWRFMLVFFGIYTGLLGVLVLKTAYIPRLMGVILLITAAGYLIENLKHFFYPNFDTGFLWFTYFGELIFMIWLLVKGSRLGEVRDVSKK